MSETVHELRTEMLERVSWRETTDLGRLGYGIASTAIDEVFAVLREHGIKLCREQVGRTLDSPQYGRCFSIALDWEECDWLPMFVPLTDEEIGHE